MALLIAAAVIALLVGAGSIVLALGRRRTRRGIREGAAASQATGSVP